MFNLWGVSHHQSTFRFPHHSAGQTRPPRRDRPGRKLRGFPRGWGMGRLFGKNQLWSASQSFCLGETISEILCFFKFWSLEKKLDSDSTPKFGLNKTKKPSGCAFFWRFLWSLIHFSIKNWEAERKPEGVKRSQFFEPVVTMGLVPPGQSWTKKNDRFGCGDGDRGKVGKCNNRDDYQKNFVFLLGGYHLQMWIYHLQMCEITFVENRWVYEKAQLIGMASFQCVSFFRGYPEIAYQIDFSGRSFILSMNTFLKKIFKKKLKSSILPQNTHFSLHHSISHLRAKIKGTNGLPRFLTQRAPKRNLKNWSCLLAAHVDRAIGRTNQPTLHMGSGLGTL